MLMKNEASTANGRWEVQRERKSSITRILMPIMSWYSALTVCVRAFAFFQSNLSRRSEKSDIPHSLVIFLILINEPDYNRVSHLFFSLSFGFDSIPIFFRWYIVALSFQQFTKWFESLVFFHSQFRLFKTPLFSHKYVLCMLFRVFCFAVFFVALFIHLKHLNQYVFSHRLHISHFAQADARERKKRLF